MIHKRVLALAALLALPACGDDEATNPDLDVSLAFDEPALDLGTARTARLVVRNTGEAAVGPIEIQTAPVEQDGVELPGVNVIATPAVLPTLNPGAQSATNLAIEGTAGLQSGSYTTQVTARVQGTDAATASITFSVPIENEAIGAVDITSAPAQVRQGDVAVYEATVRDTLGVVVPAAAVTWSTVPAGRGLFQADGRFVAYETGPLTVVARAGEAADSAQVEVSARGLSGSLNVVGHGSMLTRYTSDLWVHGDVAYTGTWGFRSQDRFGNTLYVWDVSGADPVLTDSLQVDATTVNDVKVRADGSLAVLTHEWQQTPAVKHGITLLDTSDPLHPEPLSSYIADIPTSSWVGVHNVWIDGDYVYAVVDGSASNRGLWILDVSDPSAPERVAQFWGGSGCLGRCFLHDVYVRDGLAFLSHWDAGLIILDVGNGIMGGSPTSPIEVGRVQTAGGQTHNAWYWPEKEYVFVGEEDMPSDDNPGVGEMHVVDVSDMTRPREVATFQVPGDTPHNFWLDEQNQVLYMAWYSQGLVALDVSGELMGSLERQGRVITREQYERVDACPGGFAGTCTWAPQLHEGRIYASDMNTGLWVFEPSF